jgi:hypothetical protein
VATSASTFFRQIGGTLGTAVLFSVLFSRIPDTIAEATNTDSIRTGVGSALADPKVLADPGNAQILELLRSGSASGSALDGDTSFLTTADPRLAEPFLVGFANASVTVFAVALGVVAIAFVLSLFIPAPALKDKSALQQAADDAAEESAAQRPDTAVDASSSGVPSGRGAGTPPIP